MKILTIDVETTTSNKGHWADRANKLVCIGLKWLDETPEVFWLDQDFAEYTQAQLNQCDLLVGFNIKFDLHWLLNVGIDLSEFYSAKKRIWDCQIFEFMVECQRNPYPSLNDALIKYGHPVKLDVVKTEYWDKGISTENIPKHIVKDYLDYDLIGTESVFKEQAKQFGVF
jgi:hypothetical protein